MFPEKKRFYCILQKTFKVVTLCKKNSQNQKEKGIIFNTVIRCCYIFLRRIKKTSILSIGVSKKSVPCSSRKNETMLKFQKFIIKTRKVILPCLYKMLVIYLKLRKI